MGRGFRVDDLDAGTDLARDTRLGTGVSDFAPAGALAAEGVEEGGFADVGHADDEEVGAGQGGAGLGGAADMAEDGLGVFVGAVVGEEDGGGGVEGAEERMGLVWIATYLSGCFSLCGYRGVCRWGRWRGDCRGRNYLWKERPTFSSVALS